MTPGIFLQGIVRSCLATSNDRDLLDEGRDGEGRPGFARDEPASQPTTQVVASVVHTNHGLAANMETLSSNLIL